MIAVDNYLPAPGGGIEKSGRGAGCGNIEGKPVFIVAFQPCNRYYQYLLFQEKKKKILSRSLYLKGL